MQSYPLRVISGNLIVVLLLSGCATTPRYRPPATVSQADRHACDEFAEEQKAGVLEKSVAKSTGQGLLEGLAIGMYFFVVGVMFTVPLGAIAGGVEAARENSRRRDAAYDSAMQACVEVKSAEVSLGAEDPVVATKLVNLADQFAQRRYANRNDKETLAAARAGGGLLPLTTEELLYKRALAIQENALGPEHPDVAPTLWAYARLLRERNRSAEATTLEARAQAIRGKLMQETPARVTPESPAIQMEDWLGSSTQE